MTTSCQRCTTDEDLANASLFMLTYKRDLHPAYTTLEIVTLIYSYVTQGHMLSATDADNRMVGVAAYYHGTPEQQFQNRNVALLDMAIFEKAYRGSRLFLQGMQYIVRTIMEKHPEVEEVWLAALAENNYLCRLYSKFTSTRFVREGTHGKEIVFCEKINTLRGTLNNYSKV